MPEIDEYVRWSSHREKYLHPALSQFRFQTKVCDVVVLQSVHPTAVAIVFPFFFTHFLDWYRVL